MKCSLQLDCGDCTVSVRAACLRFHVFQFGIVLAQTTSCAMPFFSFVSLQSLQKTSRTFVLPWSFLKVCFRLLEKVFARSKKWPALFWEQECTFYIPRDRMVVRHSFSEVKSTVIRTGELVRCASQNVAVCGSRMTTQRLSRTRAEIVAAHGNCPICAH
jgi:hypothetical protein